MYLLRITNPPLSGINAVMSSKKSFYPRRLYEATLSWGRGLFARCSWYGKGYVWSASLHKRKNNLPRVVMSGIAGVEMNEFVMIISCKFM